MNLKSTNKNNAIKLRQGGTNQQCSRSRNVTGLRYYYFSAWVHSLDLKLHRILEESLSITIR